MLGISSSFYAQMLTQCASCYHLNKDGKYIFTLTFSFPQAHFEPTRLGLTYSYDTGITFDLVKPFLRKTHFYMTKYSQSAKTCFDQIYAKSYLEDIEAEKSIDSEVSDNLPLDGYTEEEDDDIFLDILEKLGDCV